VPTQTNPELEARILANPDDLSAYLVYSDWLTEHGDPRGELIAVMAKLHETPKVAELEARQKKLIEDHGADWLGEFAKSPSKEVSFSWRLGFLDSVHFGPPENDYGTLEGIPEMISAFLKMPGAAFTRSIYVGSIDYDDYPTSWQPTIDALKDGGVPKGLKTLEINRGGYWDISSTELGDLSPLYPQLKKLESLTIEMGDMNFGEKLDIPSLKELVIRTGGLKYANLEAIARGDWPNLELLQIYMGEDEGDHGCTVDAEAVKEFLAQATREKFPKLKSLGLCNSSVADSFPAFLVGHPLMGQLETLDFSHGCFSNEGAQVLLANAEEFKKLKRFVLDHHYVGEDLCAQIKALPIEVEIKDGESPDEEYRYCAVSE
jgi:uncharacterized protein (TIGR02996 family)